MVSERQRAAAVRSGEAAVIAGLVREYAGVLYNYVFRRTGSWQDAETLTGQVMRGAWAQHARAPKTDAQLLPWLYGLATSAVHGRGVGDGSDRDDEVVAVAGRLRGVPVVAVDAFYLVDWEGLSDAEAAGALGTTVVAVASRLAEARAALDRGPDLIRPPVPARRPVPEHLVTEVCDAIEFGPDPGATQRPRTMLVWVLLCGVVVLAVVGATFVHRTVGHPSVATSSPSLDPPAACLASMSGDSTFGGSLRSLRVGHATLAWGATGWGRLCIDGSSEHSDQLLAQTAAGTVTGSLRVGDRYILAAAGEAGIDTQTVEAQEAPATDPRRLDTPGQSQVAAGHWLWTASVPAKHLSPLAVMTVHAAADLSYYVRWPTVPDQPLERSAVPNSKCPTTGAGPLSTFSWTMTAGALQRCQFSDGSQLLRRGDQEIPPWTGTFAMWIPVHLTSGDAMLAYAEGKLPQGADSATITTPWGMTHTTTGHGQWLWSALLPASALGLGPDHLLLTVYRRNRTIHTALVPKALEPAELGAAPSVPAATKGTDLIRDCQPSGPYVLSLGGHVLTSVAAGHPRLCVAPNPAASSPGWRPHQPTGNNSDFNPTALNTTPHTATLAYAGGTVPPGVTSIEYQTPEGPVPATIAHGLWAYEQLIGNFSVSQMPTSVTLSGPTTHTTIQLK